MGESPKDLSEHSFEEFRSDLPSFIHLLPYIMRNSDGDNAFQNTVLIVLSSDAKEASRVQKLASKENLVFLETIAFHGIEAFLKALLEVSDIILFYSEVGLTAELKDFLHDLKILRDSLSKISEFTLQESA